MTASIDLTQMYRGEICCGPGKQKISGRMLDLLKINFPQLHYQKKDKYLQTVVVKFKKPQPPTFVQNADCFAYGFPIGFPIGFFNTYQDG